MLKYPKYLKECFDNWDPNLPKYEDAKHVAKISHYGGYLRHEYAIEICLYERELLKIKEKFKQIAKFVKVNNYLYYNGFKVVVDHEFDYSIVCARRILKQYPELETEQQSECEVIFNEVGHECMDSKLHAMLSETLLSLRRSDSKKYLTLKVPPLDI